MNKGFTPKGSVKELGFEAMTENASLNTVAPKGTTGLSADLTSAIQTSSDTTVSGMPEGTFRVSGPTG